MFKYQITEEKIEIKWTARGYSRVKRNFDDAIRGDREQKTIAKFDSEDAAEAAFAKIVNENPPTMPRVYSWKAGKLANITVWELDRYEYANPDDDEDDYSDIAGIHIHDNFPAREQYDEYYADSDGEDNKTYYFADSEYFDDIYGWNDAVCIDIAEVYRLARDWGITVNDLLKQMHEATEEEIDKYGTYDGE